MDNTKLRCILYEGETYIAHADVLTLGKKYGLLCENADNTFGKLGKIILEEFLNLLEDIKPKDN